MPKYPDGFHDNRRRGPDALVRICRILAWIVWPILLAAFLLVSYARPQMETFFDRAFKSELRTSWDQTLLTYLFELMIAGAVLSVVGLLLTSLRKRRKSDRYPFSLWLMLAISLLAIIIHLL